MQKLCIYLWDAERVLSRVKSWAVMLFHNGVKNTPDALEMILKKLSEDGYKVVKASDLIYSDNYTIDHTGKLVKNRYIKTESAGLILPICSKNLVLFVL